MKLSIIIPAHNEEENIKITIEELIAIINPISIVNEIKIHIVDDHSSDKTYELVDQMNDPRIQCYRLSQRCGSHTALRAGLKQSKGDAALCISADGQDDPSCLSEMLGKWSTGTNVVWALHKRRSEESWLVQKTTRLFYTVLSWLSNTESRKIDLSRANFFLLDKAVINAVNSCQERHTSLFGLIEWLGFKQDFVEYERKDRRFGKSKWSFRNRFRLAKDWIVAFSGLPLKIITIVGFFTALSGFLYSLYIIFNAFSGNPAPGWSSIMVVVSVLAGVQMMMLGIIGEYLWRNIDESRKRPLYFVEKKTTKKNN